MSKFLGTIELNIHPYATVCYLLLVSELLIKLLVLVSLENAFQFLGFEF